MEEQGRIHRVHRVNGAECRERFFKTMNKFKVEVEADGKKYSEGMTQVIQDPKPEDIFADAVFSLERMEKEHLGTNNWFWHRKKLT